MGERSAIRSPDGVSRRAVLAGLAAAPAVPALAAPPAAIDKDAWLAYETRLRGRLADAGGGAFQPDQERELLTLTNAVRAAAGVGGCEWNDELSLTARAHAADLAQRGYVEHLSPEGFDPTHRVGLLARRMIGSASENIAYRRASMRPDASDLMGIWRKSPPHWTNLLRPSHAKIGFGSVVVGDRTYTVGLYARPDGELGSPLPFRLQGEAQLSQALDEASPRIESFALADPLDEAAQNSMSETAVRRRLAPGVYQLRPRRRIDERRYEVLWGPIFVRV